MKLKLKYRENSYFNKEDVYVFYDLPLRKVFTSKVFLENGYFYTVDSLNYKATSLKSVKL